MTIRQLYYTSCERGTEGIQGFQVNAVTPGIDRSQVDSGLQLSLYRPSPTAPSLPTPEQLNMLPVSFGYRPFGDYAVLFHSRYLGADFTGRQGNYFAHILVLDAPDQDLAGALPVDTWRGPEWRWTAADRTELPTLPTLPNGRLDRFSPGAHLREGRFPEFGRLLSAVQEGLDGGGGRIVLVAPNDEVVAQAVAVVTRSLPKNIATTVSFVTFTSAPGDVDVMIVGTSADVSIPADPLGGQTIVRMGESDARHGADIHKYARVLESCWLRSDDEANEAVALASSIRPPIAAAELDELAHLIELTVPESPHDTPDLDVLSALEFGLRRWPGVLRAPVWARVAYVVERGTPIADTARWSDVLAAAHKAGMTPPPVLLHEYLTTMLTGVAEGRLDPAQIWMPDRLEGPHEHTALSWAAATLDKNPSFAVASAVLDTLARVRVGLPEPTLRHLVDRVVVPQMLERTTADTAVAELRRMARSEPNLPRLVCDELQRLVAEPQVLRRAALTIPVEAAELLSQHASRGSLSALLFDVVAARAGRRGRQSVLAAALKNRDPLPADVQMFVDLLWPELPTATEAVALCQTIRPEVLAATKIPAWLGSRLVVDAEEAELSDDDFSLAEELGKRPILDALGEAKRTVLAVGYGGYFTLRPPHKDSVEAIRAVDSVEGVVPEISRMTLAAVAWWIFDAGDAALHADLLRDVMDRARDRREFVGAYRTALIEVLRHGKPDEVASVLPALAYLSHHIREVQPMLDTTAAMVLTGRSKRDLDNITNAIGRVDRQLRPMLKKMGRKAPKSWPIWWDEWQQAHLRRSLMSRLVARRRTAKAVD